MPFPPSYFLKFYHKISVYSTLKSLPILDVVKIKLEINKIKLECEVSNVFACIHRSHQWWMLLAYFAISRSRMPGRPENEFHFDYRHERGWTETVSSLSKIHRSPEYIPLLKLSHKNATFTPTPARKLSTINLPSPKLHWILCWRRQKTILLLIYSIRCRCYCFPFTTHGKMC